MKIIARIIGIALLNKWMLIGAYISTIGALVAYVLLPRLFGDAIDRCSGPPGDSPDGAAAAPREIRLTMEDDGVSDRIRLVVTDTGGGIPETALERIFDPFFTTKEVGQGTGLGLSISYGIVTDMGGMIEAENVEGGARFTITLRVGGDDAAA